MTFNTTVSARVPDGRQGPALVQKRRAGLFELRRFSEKETGNLAQGELMDFLSGDLDRLFSVLFELGRVEPLLNKDWKALYRESQMRWPEVSQAIGRLNDIRNMKDMRSYIQTLPMEIVDALVIEVAREMAQFHGRDELLH